MQKVEMILEYEYSIQRAVCMQLHACMCARLHKGVQFVPSKSACLHAGLLDCFLDDQQQYHGQAFIPAKVAWHCVALGVRTLHHGYVVHGVCSVRGSCICSVRGRGVIRAAS